MTKFKTFIFGILILTISPYLKAQNHKHSFSIGANYTFHHLQDGLLKDTINNRTSLKVDNNFSFQSKRLSDNSKLFLGLLYKLDLAYNYHWTINRSFTFSSGIAGSGRNFTLAEYPLSWKDGKPIDLPANKLNRRYYTVSVPAILKYKVNRRISFNAGLNFNYSMLEKFESSFYNTNPENIFYFTGQIGLETRLGKNWFLYCQYNQGLVNVFNDKVVLYSQLAYNGYPYRTNCYTKGNTIQAGFIKYFDPKEVQEKLKLKDFSIHEITTVDSSKLELCIENENNKSSLVDIYLNKILLGSDILIDSVKYCINLNLEKNKKYKLKLISQNEEEVITTVSIIQNNTIKNKAIWKPNKRKRSIIWIRPKY